MNIYLDSFVGQPYVFNVGQTTRAYAERHNDGDYGKAKQVETALEAERVQLGWWTDVDLTDHQIHAWLKK